MAQQFLYGADVGARLQEVGGKAVAQRVHRYGFDDAGQCCYLLQAALQSLFVQMMAALNAAAPVG